MGGRGGQRNFFFGEKGICTAKTFHDPTPTPKAPSYHRKCVHHWRNKEALESGRILTLPAQLRRTSAMRPLVLALLAICFLTEFMAEGKPMIGSA